MILEGREGTTNLNTLYKQLNKQYFNGALPNIKVSWNARLTNAVGRAHVTYVGQKISRSMQSLINRYAETIPAANVEIDMKSLSISISKKYDLSANDIKAVMLHEMVHILLYTQKKLGGHHDTPEFDGWIKKLIEQSGLDIPFKESAFKRSPKIAPKDGFVMLLRQSDGRYGISTFSTTWMFKQWFIFAETMTRIMNFGSKIQNLVFFRIKHRLIVDYPARRSLRKISWTLIDDELAEEIKKKGKFWGEAFKGGGRIEPHLVGMGDKEIKKVPIELGKDGKPTNMTEVFK